jgi:hypothetical protein
MVRIALPACGNVRQDRESNAEAGKGYQKDAARLGGQGLHGNASGGVGRP